MWTLAGTGKKFWIVHCAKSKIPCFLFALCSIITTFRRVNRGQNVHPAKIWGCWSMFFCRKWLSAGTVYIQNSKTQLWKFEPLSNFSFWKRRGKNTPSHTHTHTQLQGKISLRLFSRLCFVCGSCWSFTRKLFFCAHVSIYNSDSDFFNKQHKQSSHQTDWHVVRPQHLFLFFICIVYIAACCICSTNTF